jgi:SAM-dependent methyltransferase
MPSMTIDEPVRVPSRDAAYFDEWYANMAASPVVDAIAARTLGLPPELQSTSLLPWQGIAEVIAALALTEGGLLVDLACGRGGYGIEIARRTGARLAGVDFSKVAIAQAEANGARLHAPASGNSTSARLLNPEFRPPKRTG